MKSSVSFLLKASTPFFFFVVLILAIYLLLRGHNLPGGGFIGGLALSMAMLLHGLAHGFDNMEFQMRIDPIRLATYGLALSLGTALAPVFFRRPFFEHFQTYVQLPYLGKTAFGTPMLFDIGVFMVVVGIATKVIFIMARSTSGRCGLLDSEVDDYASPSETPIETEENRDAN